MIHAHVIVVRNLRNVAEGELNKLNNRYETIKKIFDDSDVANDKIIKIIEIPVVKYKIRPICFFCKKKIGNWGNRKYDRKIITEKGYEWFVHLEYILDLEYSFFENCYQKIKEYKKEKSVVEDK